MSLGALIASVLLVPFDLEAQSLTTATVSGAVTTSSGQLLPGALVTLSALQSGPTHEATTDAVGRFSFAIVTPGSYEVRVEALGFRPVLARTLALAGGEREELTLVLSEAPPPVLLVDTVVLGATSSSRWRAGGMRLGAAELRRLPHRFEELSSIVALAPVWDETLGSQGLPGTMARVVADGVPFFRAPHPVARSEQAAEAAFPLSSLSGVTAFHNPPDVEFSGSAAGYLSLASRTGTREGGLELDGGWSGDPLWSSNELGGSKPSLTSFQGAARTTIPVAPGASDIVVAGAAIQQENPLGPRISESVAGQLVGLDPDLVSSLSGASVETYSRFAALGRFDAQPDPDAHLFVRGNIAYLKREFDGPGPVSIAADVAVPEETVEYSVAGGYLFEYRRGLDLELRGGVSGSGRTFDPAAQGMPPAFLTGSASSLGVLAAGLGKSSRTDGVLLPTLRYEWREGVVKVGASLRASRHAMSHAVPGEFFYSDGATLVGGQGLARSLSAPEVSFSTYEFGLFAQYATELSPGVEGSVAARYDVERIPSSGATPNTAWEQTSGLMNALYPNSFHQVGGRASLSWEPSDDGSTRVSGTLSVDYGDLDTRVLSQLFAQDDGATTTRYAGSGLTWPGGALPSAASPRATVTLMGPDARPPRSARASAALVRRLVGELNVHLGAAYRRTDFLMRRRNLNRALLGSAVDPHGRDVFGTLQQDGTLVSALPDARRFSGFNEVWALDPDGWSEYYGATGGLEYTGTSTSLYVVYTRSETTDNWIGAGSGRAEAELSPSLPGAGGDWSAATSDYDVPHRVVASASRRIGPIEVAGAYRFRSGLPFTPGYRPGVDANGDGSMVNDVAFVAAAAAAPLLSDWSCLESQLERFAARNSCRGPSVHSLDARLRLGLGSLGGRDIGVVLDAFNLIETGDGVVDRALVLVDPAASITTSPDGSTVTVPTSVNPDFGRVLYPSSRGRMLRIGIRIG